MGIWTIVYITESGYEGEVEVSAVNKFMAWDVFGDIAKDFDEKVVSADCFLVKENKMNETVKIWLEDLINKEIDEVLDDIESRKTWCLKISDKEVLQILLDRLCLDNEYLTALKAIKNRIEREDL